MPNQAKHNVELGLAPDVAVAENVSGATSKTIGPQVVPSGAVKGIPSEVLKDSEGNVLFPDPMKSKRNQLHLAWAQFLSTQDWQWFVTFTFKEEIHPEAADKLFRVWINKLNRDLYGQRWRKKPSGGVKWVRALEWQKRGVLHYHALMSNVGYASRERWAVEWMTLGDDGKAGFIRIDQYDESLGGAEAYLSKYVAKDGDIDISANFGQVNIIPDHEHKRTFEFAEVARS